MPSIKEKCVCQICICGEHHCGEEIVVPTSLQASSNQSQSMLKASSSSQLDQPPLPVATVRTESIIIPIEIVSSDVYNETFTDNKQQQQELSPKATDQTQQQQKLIDECTQSCQNNTNNFTATTKHKQIRTTRTEASGLKKSTGTSKTNNNKKPQLATTTKTRLTTTIKRQEPNQVDADSDWIEIRGEDEQEEQPRKGRMQHQTTIDFNMRQEQEQAHNQTNDYNTNAANHRDINCNGSSGNNQQQQRKTWQTSPEQVQELTRSLSRMRTDADYNGFCYEKFVEKEQMLKQKNRSAAATSKKQSNGHQQSKRAISTQANQINYSLPNKMVNGNSQPPATNDPGGSNDPPPREPSFLPPLTGFSDSDSFRSSISSTADEEEKIKCICESMRKTLLNDSLHPPHQQYICSDSFHERSADYADNNDNWIVIRPERTRPRDNLRLEGPMDMETTFHASYVDGNFASGRNQLKRSVPNTTSSTRSSKTSPQLYLGTRKGRTVAAAGTVPLPSSARRRRTNRNRPMTSLKAGGHGYYHTNNREAFKNFIIVNGEAKTVPTDQVKLPKVMMKKTTSTTLTEDRNRQNYVNKTKLVKIETKKTINQYDNDNDQEQTRTGKFHTVNDSKQSQSETVGQPASQKGYSENKMAHHDVGTNEEHKYDQSELKNDNWTVENHYSKRRQFNTRNIDNIQDLGILELGSANVKLTAQNAEMQKLNATTKVCPHMRRLHETSEDLQISHNDRDVSDFAKTQRKHYPVPDTSQRVPDNQSKQSKPATVGGHAVMVASKKPFIMPQRSQRHKNDSTMALEGEMDFSTTNRTSYGDNLITRQQVRSRNGGGRPASSQRKRTAGRRYLKSSKRRNLFRQSSDSMFSRPESRMENRPVPSKPAAAVTNAQTTTSTSNRHNANNPITSTYKSEFDDRLYCPAFDVNTSSKFTGETGGHKYYLQSNYQ